LRLRAPDCFPAWRLYTKGRKAMHMADQFLSPPVYISSAVVAAAALAVSLSRSRREVEDRHVPIMGVLGAFVFAAQMVNFPILPGVSGHLCGGVLLAILLGPFRASLLITAVLIVQCFLFQDGGVLALGVNIINMGIVPPYLGYAVWRVLDSRLFINKRVSIFIAAWCGVIAGACLAPFQIYFSGVMAFPLSGFLILMLGYHALIGIGEGLITVAVVDFLSRTRSMVPLRSGTAPGKVFVFCCLGAALIIGSSLSLLASEYPDGLEKAIENEVAVSEEQGCAESSADDGENNLSSLNTAPFPDYKVKGLDEKPATAAAGCIGTMGCFVLLLLLGRLLLVKH